MFELGNTAVLIWSIIFGSIGTGFAIYGIKTKGHCPVVHWSSPLCLSLLHRKRLLACLCWSGVNGNSIFCPGMKPSMIPSFF